MLGVTLNYQQVEQFLIKELHVEWVHKPFLDRLSLDQYLDMATRHGKVELFGESYSPKEIESLSKETEGRISEFKFSTGPCEGYLLLLKMESGQIFNVKTFDRNTFELFFGWVNRLEACHRDEPRRETEDAIPVGSIVYKSSNFTKRKDIKMDDVVEVLKDKLSLIAYCSSMPGNRLNGLEHAMRWVEKAKWASEALEAIEKSDNEEICPIIEPLKNDLQQIKDFPYKQKLEENTRLNHALVCYMQIGIGRTAYQKLINYLETA